ncbi:hypothetical protein JTE90_008757 [Oedothorax gibbosus]|uniref:Uncharacterized protein n=1 Tax=Oedothorax gibbosus TaxID=931172 RepID=A0AAV6URJ8_9ARAC|nr:hypothetical protein JTE90_008757 [Oedothorax gibbosus]
MTILKFRSLFLLLFFQCYLGYAIKGEADNDYPTVQDIKILDTDISNSSAKEETDLPIQKSSDHLSNDNESHKSTKIRDHETDESTTNLSEDITNKTIDQSTNHTLTKNSDYETDGSKTNPTEDITNNATDQSANPNQTMFSKIGVRGGKTGGSKVGGLKGGGSKTRIGGGRGIYWRPRTKSSGGGGDGLTALWIILGIVGVCGGGFLVVYLFVKYAGSCATE